jgi:hypothetical protein
MSEVPLTSLILNEPADIYTGMTEHTDLEDVDRAVAGFFKAVVSSLVVTDTARPENKEFARFVDRPSNRKIYMGSTPDTQTFVRKLVKKLGQGENAIPRNELLPAVLISRDPGFTFADGTDYTDLTHYAAMTNDSSEIYAHVNKSFVKMTYTIKAVAWNRPTLNRLALGLMMWIRHTKQGLKHTFQAKTMLAGAPLTVNVSIEGRREAALMPEEFDFEENRVLTLPFSVEVVAEVFEAEQVVRTPILVDLMEGDLIE